MTPTPLNIAAKLYFPHGGATASTLRAAIRSGDLKAALVGRCYMVTEQDINEWVRTCRDRAKARASTSSDGKAVRRSGSSVTERAKLAQAALNTMLTGPGKDLRRTFKAHSGLTPESAT